MKIKFCGAARSVTGSCHMMEFAGKKILVDCGMRQGADKKTELGEGGFPFDPAEIDAVLLTHAHIDHSGLIPLLTRRGFTGRIIATRATAELAGIMLPDSGHIQEQEAEYQNRKNLRAGKPPVQPLYTAGDAVDSLKAFKPVTYNEITEVVPGMRARFVDAGHLLGSAAIEVWANEGGRTVKLAFSGDIGRDNRPILQDPQPIDGADYVLMEGTYGDRDHDVREANDKEMELASLLREGMARGGNIVIPSFAVGRTQELLYYIKKLLMHNTVPGLERVPVYVDSPLGINATAVYERNAADYYDDEAKELARSGSPFSFPTLRVTQTAEESKSINFQPGCNIIISSSGMCDAGRIRHHLKHNLYRSDSTVIFAGYQAVGTLGRLLVDGVKKVKLFGEEIRVVAAIRKAEGFSGHAGRSELVEWLQKLGRKPKCVFLIHGEERTLESFASTLGEMGHTVAIPAMLSEYALTYTDEAALPELTAAGPESPDVFAPRVLALAAREWRLNGAVCVRKDGLPLYETAFGFADAERRRLNTPHTRFAAGDITQSFTATLLLLLEKHKALSLRDTLDRYVPEYVRAAEFTLGELLFTKKLAPDYVENALAGKAEARIREAGLSGADAERARFAAATADISDAEFLSILNGLPFSPDDDDQGARSNFRLLGMAAERAANRPLAELMREKLFAPLGMEETSLGGAPDAVYSEASDGGFAALGSPQSACGDAGIVTSAVDLMKWLEALRTGALLGKAGTRKMFSAKDDGRACGFERDYGWHHAFAGFEGYRTAVYLSLKYGVAFALLANAPSNDLTSPASPDATGAYTLPQRLRRELDTTYLACENPKLVPINKANFTETMRLKVTPEQENYVAGNAYSLAQAYAMRNVARPYAVTQDGIPVGFVMLFVERKKELYEIWRFMIDARFQHRGFGEAAMELALAEMKKRGAKKVGLSVAPDNAAATRVYERAGFRFTGKVSGGEAHMERDL